jgi:hypothetical protein
LLEFLFSLYWRLSKCRKTIATGNSPVLRSYSDRWSLYNLQMPNDSYLLSLNQVKIAFTMCSILFCSTRFGEVQSDDDIIHIHILLFLL